MFHVKQSLADFLALFGDFLKPNCELFILYLCLHLSANSSDSTPIDTLDTLEDLCNQYFIQKVDHFPNIIGFPINLLARGENRGRKLCSMVHGPPFSFSGALSLPPCTVKYQNTSPIVISSYKSRIFCCIKFF